MKPVVVNPFRVFSCTFMMLAVLWLSTGFAFIQPERDQTSTGKPVTKENNTKKDNEESASYPYENTTEEKAETSEGSFAADYPFEHSHDLSAIDIPLKHNKIHSAEAFINYFGDSVSQPPEKLS